MIIMKLASLEINGSEEEFSPIRPCAWLLDGQLASYDEAFPHVEGVNQ